ncbi:MAG: hypothetical protein E6G86_09405 [Alphaproteobacteria bacterium]|nr:MAG: hypothetical protein E6G86_09405 [Alphaproteobacteria bacterium]
MTDANSADRQIAQQRAHQPWLKLAALVLVVAALGLPINDLFRYALLVVAAVLVVAGTIAVRVAPWLGALAAVALCVLGQILFAAPRIEEGENVFIIDASGGALEAGLPREAFRRMLQEFDAKYLHERRCAASQDGCWRGQGFPTQTFAFSADGIFQRPAYSRRVTGIDFSDPIWLRLGFINELSYNWNSQVSELARAHRDRRSAAFLHQWTLAMPWFVMYRFPADFVGSALCWRGEVLWEGGGEQFAAVTHGDMACRTLTPQDIGRRIFGVAIAHDLAMRLDPTWPVRLRQLVEPALALAASAAVLALIVRVRARRLVLQRLLAGDIAGTLEGGEAVFYYTPALRYLRAAEHVVFGESYLGYLSLILLLPFLVFALFRRFLPMTWALALTLIFAAIPVGIGFGSSLVQYVKWAARGFADPAAYVLFLAGFVLLLGRLDEDPRERFARAFGAGLLFALALAVRPNIAPAAGVLLAGAGIAALVQREFARAVGLALGFAPVLALALHNWIYGGAFVLFTTTATHPLLMVMPPSAYLAALGELAHGEVAGEHVVRALKQIGAWLAGPSEAIVMAPLNAAAVAVLLRVMLMRAADPWLRLTAGATLAQHAVALVYASAGRYTYLTWLFTLLVVAAWVHGEGLNLLRRYCPRFSARMAKHPGRLALARALQRMTGMVQRQ